MKQITIEQLENTNGGSVAGGICGAVATVSFGVTLGLWAINPVVGAAYTALEGACVGYTLYSMFN